MTHRPNQAVRRGEGVREVREGDAGAAGDAVQAAGRLHRAHPQEGPLEDPLQVSYTVTSPSCLLWFNNQIHLHLQELGENCAHRAPSLGQW